MQHPQTDARTNRRSQSSNDRQTPITRRIRLISVLCACAAGLLALIGLFGWLSGDLDLTRLHGQVATMKFDTTLMLVLLAIGRVTRGRFGICCATLAGVIAAVTLAECVVQHDLGIDQLLFTDPGGGAHPGRPSLVTAVAALLLAIAALPTVARRQRLTETLTLTVFAAAFLAALSYVYGVQSLYALRPHSTVAVNTAAALMLLAVAALSAVERGVMRWIVAGAKPGAVLMRIVAPASLIVLPAGGYVCVQAERRGWATGAGLVALNVLFCITALLAASWLAGVRLDRVDKHRRQVVAQLHDVTDDLERQVLERSNQVERGRDELVLLADRQRIAADLHDIVVQRLFATGMTLNSVPLSDVESDVGRRIVDAVESMDTAILDLRSAIFELSKSDSDHGDLTSALDDLCTDAARVLGFSPDLTVDDPDCVATSELHADILAVAREALANVARHAEATGVQVVLRTREATLTLEVIDNGLGIDSAPHSSGTQNMSDRARRLGGECVWASVEPHGTRVCWQVPIAPGADDDGDVRELAEELAG